MRIGIDCRTILNPQHGEKAGVGHYTYFLVKHLLKHDKKNTYVLFVDHHAPNLKEFQKKNVEIVRFSFSEYKRYLPIAYSHVFVSRVLNKANLDIFHSPANVIPLRYSKPSVVTVHDLAIYDHPEWFPGGQNFSTKLLVPKSIQKADAVIAVSQATANDITNKFGRPAKRIHTILAGVDREKAPTKTAVKKIQKKYRLDDVQYLLYLGTLEPRKNIAGLISAFDAAAVAQPKKYKSVRLILAGAKGYQFEENYKAIMGAKSGRIRYIGYVPAVDKAALIAGATGFVFPSMFEGFGLPVLEAMRLGVPVITSKTSSLIEVAGKAALMVNPESQRSIQLALHKLIGDKRKRTQLITAGKKQAKGFSWDTCAKQTLKVYKQVHTDSNASV